MSRKFSLRRSAAAALVALAATFSVGAAAVDADPAPEPVEEQQSIHHWTGGHHGTNGYGGTWS